MCENIDTFIMIWAGFVHARLSEWLGYALSRLLPGRRVAVGHQSSHLPPMLVSVYGSVLKSAKPTLAGAHEHLS